MSSGGGCTLGPSAGDGRTGVRETAGSAASHLLPSPTGETAGRPVTGCVLDLPVPPSVNRTRRGDFWTGSNRMKRWHQAADGLLLAARFRPLFLERFELHVTFSEQRTDMDLDNGLKALIDYLRRIEAIADDAPKNLRRLVVEWGEAPEGVRVEIRPVSP